MTTIAVLMTSFNRKDATLRSLKCVLEQEANAGIVVKAVLVDACSSDGTAVAVRAMFSQVEVVSVDSSVYWNGGMCAAFDIAQADNPDFYLMLNDDTYLYTRALSELLDLEGQYVNSKGSSPIVVGAVSEPDSSSLSYSGLRRRGRANMRFELVGPGSEDSVPDTMNGNCVLLSRSVVEEIGFLDRRFTHGYGDIDYGLRATRAGIPILISDGFVGVCASNSTVGTWQDSSLGLIRRLRLALSPKGIPARDQLTFVRNHCGMWWPVFFARPYFGIFTSTVSSSWSRAVHDRR